MTNDTASSRPDPVVRSAARWMGFQTQWDERVEQRKDLEAEIAHDAAFPLIIHHLGELKASGEDVNHPDVIRRAITLGRTEHEDFAARNLSYSGLVGLSQSTGTHPPVVYYASMGDLVKIGTTISLRTRMKDLGVRKVLAVEPGDLAQERKRHRQFELAHSHGEWFFAHPELIQHTESLRETFHLQTKVDCGEWIGQRLQAGIPNPRERRSMAGRQAKLPQPGVPALVNAAMAARLAGVTKQLFNYWKNTGKITPVGLSPEGRNLYKASDALDLRIARNLG